ncbi:MIP03712p [Strongyloides ratti]|uniref:MIP03712p n=1 Tax=Strongyloides ratti TaxID=34506 RepID=A0A090LST2_STRRB|nr:MIP03712p [Strongyloides ratti]CEF71247.1 MIP03712p [Strongyloides ratti]
MSAEELSKDFTDSEKETLSKVASAGKGVTQVMHRCEAAKTSGYLDLSSCSLMYIADAIYLVLKGYMIDKVSLQDNDLQKFPIKMITKFPQLYFINVRKNKIKEIPDELNKWEKVKAANFASNKLTVFPEAIYSWSNLAILDISENEIDTLDVIRLFTACKKLTILNIKDTLISENIIKSIKNYPGKVANFKLEC